MIIVNGPLGVKKYETVEEYFVDKYKVPEYISHMERYFKGRKVDDYIVKKEAMGVWRAYLPEEPSRPLLGTNKGRLDLRRKLQEQIDKANKLYKKREEEPTAPVAKPEITAPAGEGEIEEHYLSFEVKYCFRCEKKRNHRRDTHIKEGSRRVVYKCQVCEMKTEEVSDGER